MADKLPIVYVRGFAGDPSGINKAATDPFYGFNEGSTHVRVGGDGEPVFYQFESPLRLLLDEDYEILVDGGQLAYLESHDKVRPTASGSTASMMFRPAPGGRSRRTIVWNEPPRTCSGSSKPCRPKRVRRGSTWWRIPWAG